MVIQEFQLLLLQLFFVHREFARVVAIKLRKISGVDMQTAPDLIEATQDTGAYVQLSGVLKRFAVKLSKICNDLRFLSSGPRAGINEINLPAVQPGSSIMPGKVNPVIPDVVNEIAFQVIGADVTITMAAEAGQLATALNPILGYEKASWVANQAYTKGKTVAEIVIEEKLLSAERLAEVLNLQNMVNPDVSDGLFEP